MTLTFEASDGIIQVNVHQKEFKDVSELFSYNEM